MPACKPPISTLAPEEGLIPKNLVHYTGRDYICLSPYHHYHQIRHVSERLSLSTVKLSLSGKFVFFPEWCTRGVLRLILIPKLVILKMSKISYRPFSHI